MARSTGRGWLPACALLLPLACAAAAPAETGRARPLALTLDHYGLEEGLSQLTVTALAEDDRGFLWIGTQEGLNRFDGHRFRVFGRGTDGGASLVSSSIESLAFDTRSRLWIGTNDGGLEVMDLRTGEHRRLGVDAGVSHQTVQQILLDPAGGAWLGTSAGIDHVDAGVAFVRHLGATAPVVGLRARADAMPWALDRDCALWAAGPSTLQRLPTQLPEGMRCVDLRLADAGTWVATANAGVFLLAEDGSIVRHVEAWALRPRPVEITAMNVRSDGVVLLGYPDGEVVELPGTGQGTARPATFDAPSGTAITLFHEHSSGVLWIGTLTEGLFGARTLSPAVRNDVLAGTDMTQWPSRSVRSIWRDGDHWMVGTDGGLMVRRARGDWSMVEEIGITSIRDIAPDPDGGWWIGSHRGLWSMAPGGSVRAVPGAPDPAVTNLLVDGEVLWVATRGGLARFRNGIPDPAAVPVVLRDQFLTTLMQDDSDRLWIGSNERGAFLLHVDGTLQQLDTRNDRLVHDSVWSLYEGPDAWWIGTFSAGVQRIDRRSGTVDVVSEREGLSNGVVYTIVPAADGRLWMSTNNGLSVVDPATRSVQTLLQADGLRNREFNSGASFADADGLLYFGGTEGVDVVEPARLAGNSAPAVPVPSGLRVLGRSGAAQDGGAGRVLDTVYAERVVLDYRDSVLSLDMVAIDFTAPDAARLRYRIEGVYSDWVHPQGPRAELVLSYLAPGTYPLELQAAGRDGRYGDTRRLTIVMPPPPWRHPLAYAGYGLLALGLLAWMGFRVRSRVRAERAQIDLLNRTVADRTAELEQANRMLLQSNRQLDLANRTDPLTRVSNRRDLQEWLDREGEQVVGEAAAEAPGSCKRLFFCMVDIDDFKHINDRHGHQTGDEVLVEIAQRLRLLCRERDAVVRWGGEEFMLLLRDLRVEDVTTLVERVRRALADAPVQLRSGAVLPVACSAGFAPWPLSCSWPTLGAWDQSVSLADRALYAAKQSGKNAWVGVVPAADIDRSTLLSLLAGAAPETLPPERVAILHSPGIEPHFARG